MGPVGASLSAEHSANRLAFINGDALTIEYSKDGGTTWNDYGLTANQKSWLCTDWQDIPIGRVDRSEKYTTNSKTRITIFAQPYFYTDPKKLLVNVSVSGHTELLIEYKKGIENAEWETYSTTEVSGWSGWNDIDLQLGSLGGGSSQTENNWYLRLTFSMKSVEESYAKTADVLGLRLFGINDWGSASEIAGKGKLSSTGHVYSYDADANVTFPNGVNAKTFNGHTVESNVPSDAKFTDTTYSRFKQGTPSSNPVDGLVPAPNSKASERAMLTVGGWKELDLHVGHTSDGKLMIGQLWSDEYVLMDEIPVATQKESGAMSSDDKKKLDDIDVDTLKAELKKYIDQNSSGGVSIDTIYPVGSIYLTMDIKFDPNKSFGGTWEITSEGKALFGADITGQDPDFEVPGLTGGEKTHTLTVDELPEHNHNIKVESEELKGSVWNFVGQNANYGPGNSTSGVFSKGGDGTCFYPSSTGKATGINDGFVLDATHDHTATSGNTGSGTAHNNLPPYQTIVVWQRTA